MKKHNPEDQIYDYNRRGELRFARNPINCGSPEIPAEHNPPKFPSRKAMRLKGYDYSWDGAYFITICCHEKRHLFGYVTEGKMILNQYGKIAQAEWQRTKDLRKNVFLDSYVVMPNHFHAILIIKTEDNAHVPQIASTVGDVMKGYKQAVTIGMRSLGYSGKVWQRGYYDHIIRNIYDYDATMAYITNNPQNWSKDQQQTERK